jgi:hypothetical protein
MAANSVQLLSFVFQGFEPLIILQNINQYANLPPIPTYNEIHAQKQPSTEDEKYACSYSLYLPLKREKNPTNNQRTGRDTDTDAESDDDGSKCCQACDNPYCFSIAVCCYNTAECL